MSDESQKEGDLLADIQEFSEQLGDSNLDVDVGESLKNIDVLLELEGFKLPETPIESEPGASFSEGIVSAGASVKSSGFKTM